MEFESEIIKIRFEKFMDCVSKYLDFFGLKTYDCTYNINSEDMDNNAYVSVDSQRYQSRKVEFTICGALLSSEDFDKEVDRVAFHEVCELWYMDTHEFTLEKFVSDTVAQNFSHKAVVFMMNEIYPLLKNKGELK